MHERENKIVCECKCVLFYAFLWVCVFLFHFLLFFFVFISFSIVIILASTSIPWYAWLYGLCLWRVAFPAVVGVVHIRLHMWPSAMIVVLKILFSPRLCRSRCRTPLLHPVPGRNGVGHFPLIRLPTDFAASFQKAYPQVRLLASEKWIKYVFPASSRQSRSDKYACIHRIFYIWIFCVIITPLCVFAVDSRQPWAGCPSSRATAIRQDDSDFYHFFWNWIIQYIVVFVYI